MFKVTLAEREYIAIFRRINNCLGFEIEIDNSVELRNLWKNNIFKVIKCRLIWIWNTIPILYVSK